MILKKIVKVSFQHGYADMSRYLSEKFFAEYQIEINNKDCVECDYWIVYGNLPCGSEEAIVNPKNVFFIATELDGDFSEAFLNQFARVITVDTHYKTNNIIYAPVGLPWFINNSFDELYSQQNINKDNLLSIVVSNKSHVSYTRNYKIRYDFVKAAIDYFGDSIDVYGRGFKELKHKEDGLLPYKYSIALENVPLYNGFSEKLADCLLTHTLPFYWDCPNIDRFFSSESMVRLDIMDIKYSLKIIEDVLSDSDFYHSHLNAVILAKKKYLEKFSFHAIIVNIIENFGNRNAYKKKVKVSQSKKIISMTKIISINKIYSMFSKY